MYDTEGAISGIGRAVAMGYGGASAMNSWRRQAIVPTTHAYVDRTKLYMLNDRTKLYTVAMSKPNFFKPNTPDIYTSNTPKRPDCFHPLRS